MTQMKSCVLAADVYDRHARPVRIVQIGQSIRQAGTKVQQSACWLLRDPGVPVRGAGDNTFEQRQNASHLGGVVERRDNMDLRCARIRETDIHGASEQGSH